MQIENAVNAKLNSASSESLRNGAIRVRVSSAREVTLDGAVQTPDDFATAESLAASVHGVVGVRNRLRVIAQPQNGQNPPPAQAESPDSLIQKGMGFLDTGDYPSAIDSFNKALTADPSSKQAQDSLARAKKAQQAEEELLKKRR